MLYSVYFPWPAELVSKVRSVIIKRIRGFRDVCQKTERDPDTELASCRDSERRAVIEIPAEVKRLDDGLCMTSFASSTTSTTAVIYIYTYNI